MIREIETMARGLRWLVPRSMPRRSMTAHVGVLPSMTDALPSMTAHVSALPSRGALPSMTAHVGALPSMTAHVGAVFAEPNDLGKDDDHARITDPRHVQGRLARVLAH